MTRCRMRFRCAQCRALTQVQIPAKITAPVITACSGCGRKYRFAVDRPRAADDQERYRRAKEFAETNQIDLGSAYSVLEGVMSIEEARGIRKGLPVQSLPQAGAEARPGIAPSEALPPPEITPLAAEPSLRPTPAWRTAPTQRTAPARPAPRPPRRRGAPRRTAVPGVPPRAGGRAGAGGAWLSRGGGLPAATGRGDAGAGSGRGSAAGAPYAPRRCPLRAGPAAADDRAEDRF